MSEYLRVVSNTIETKSNRLHQIGRYLWENPETKYEEYKAHDYITDFLEAEGFPVQRNYILPTAFRAEFGGKTPLNIPKNKKKHAQDDYFPAIPQPQMFLFFSAHAVSLKAVLIQERTLVLPLFGAGE